MHEVSDRFDKTVIFAFAGGIWNIDRIVAPPASGAMHLKPEFIFKIEGVYTI